MSGIEYLFEVEEIINNLTDEDIINIFDTDNEREDK